MVQDRYAWAKGGKQYIRDSGLIGVSDEEIKRLARDQTVSPQDRARYIREEKARRLRNQEKRSNFELSDPWGEILIGGGSVIAGVASAWWAAKALAPAFGPLAPVWLIVG